MIPETLRIGMCFRQFHGSWKLPIKMRYMVVTAVHHSKEYVELYHLDEGWWWVYYPTITHRAAKHTLELDSSGVTAPYLEVMGLPAHLFAHGRDHDLSKIIWLHITREPEELEIRI